MHGYYCSNAHWFWLWPIGFFVVLFIVFGLSRIVWWRGGRYRRGYYYGDALAVASARYARGEISKEQLATIKKELNK